MMSHKVYKCISLNRQIEEGMSAQVRLSLCKRKQTLYELTGVPKREDVFSSYIVTLYILV